jgi:hypothetical protein
LNALPESIKAKIARASRNKGSNYEREVAKKISAYFGWEWANSFYRTKPHGMAQPNGDIQPINEMNDLWRAAKLGPLECKSRKEWSFDQLFKEPKNSCLYRYWEKSNNDTNRKDTVLLFTKPSVSDYVMTANRNLIPVSPALTFQVDDDYFLIQTLKSFLVETWPKGDSV